MVRLLLKMGGKPSAKNNGGKTPAEVAASSGKTHGSRSRIAIRDLLLKSRFQSDSRDILHFYDQLYGNQIPSPKQRRSKAAAVAGSSNESAPGGGESTPATAALVLGDSDHHQNTKVVLAPLDDAPTPTTLS